VAGEIDLTNVHHLETLIFKANNSRGGAIILDLDGVTYLDSTMFSALMKWANHMRILIVKPKTINALKLFDLIGLSRVVSVFDTIEDATARLAQKTP
jgi:anti-anti-sigma factor